MACIPDLRQLSYDPVCDRLEVLDGHLDVPCQVLAVLHPDDGGLQPVVRDVDGAVEFSFVALGQLDHPYGGFKSQLTELLRGQVGPWNMASRRLTCILETYLRKIKLIFDSSCWMVWFNLKLNLTLCQKHQSNQNNEKFTDDEKPARCSE